MTSVLKFTSPMLLMVLVLTMLATLAPQPTRYILRSQEGDVIENVEINWIEDLETYPEHDCGHNIIFHYSRIVNPDQFMREDLDPCSMIAVSVREIMQRALDRIRRNGFDLVRITGAGAVERIIEEGDLSFGAWKKIMNHPYFYQTVMEILREIQVEAGYGHLPTILVR